MWKILWPELASEFMSSRLSLIINVIFNCEGLLIRLDEAML